MPTAEFEYQDPFPVEKDDTEYRLLTKEFVSESEFDGQKVLKVDPQTGASSVFASIPGGGPNALAFDAAGNVYVSDSFQATIWRIPPARCLSHSMTFRPTSPSAAATSI